MSDATGRLGDLRGTAARPGRRAELPAPEALTRALARAGGGSVRAVVLYGSYRLGMAGEHSAVDLLAVVSSYRRFYRALGEAGELPRPVWLMTAAAHVLPPNVIAFAPEGERGAIAKVVVTDEAHLDRALGPNPKDHFLLGRMIQDVRVLWAADDGARAWVEARIVGALEGVMRWSAPYLPRAFDAESLGKRLLEVLYRGEVRPESGDRSGVVFEAQREHFRARLGPVLERAAEAGVLVREGNAYRLAREPGAATHVRWRLHFMRSKARATARWMKHVITFANWLPYVVRKVERHTGQTIELTRLERRWPLVFLWPRALKVLWSQRRGPERSR